MEYINFSNDVMAIVSLIANIFFIIPVSYKIYIYFTQKRYIKKVLGYNKEPVQIYQSTQELKSKEGYISHFITFNILESLNNILKFFAIRNQEFKLISQNDNARNEMCLGGYLTNKRTNSYLVRYFPDFKYCVDQSSKEVYEEFPIDTAIFKYTDGKTGFQIGDEFYETILNKKDYAFLIKLIPDDFKFNKTVHILFGEKPVGTVKATEFLTTHYKDIYKKYKGNHYFFAIEINLVDNSFNLKDGIIDLTDKMFIQ